MEKVKQESFIIIINFYYDDYFFYTEATSESHFCQYVIEVFCTVSTGHAVIWLSHLLRDYLSNTSKDSSIAT